MQHFLARYPLRGRSDVEVLVRRNLIIRLTDSSDFSDEKLQLGIYGCIRILMSWSLYE